MRTIAVINQKGGVGKTTTAANLGAAIGVAGYDICLIDMDPQAHLTLHFGIEPGSTPLSIYDVLTQETALAPATSAVKPHVWVVPSVIDLAAAEIELVSMVGREQILRDRLDACPMPYDVVLIDCPPSLGLLTLNALAAADEVLIPLQPHFLALQGLGKLLETVSLVQRRINPRLRVSGVVLCMYERNTRLANEVLADLQNFFNQARNSRLPWAQAKIFNTVIRRNIKLAECPSFGRTIFDYEPSSNGALDYRNLAAEFLAGMAPPQPKPAMGGSAPAAPAEPAVVIPSVTFRPGPPPSEPEETEPAEAAAPPTEIANCALQNADLPQAAPAEIAECELQDADSPEAAPAVIADCGADPLESTSAAVSDVVPADPPPAEMAVPAPAVDAVPADQAVQLTPPGETPVQAEAPVATADCESRIADSPEGGPAAIADCELRITDSPEGAPPAPSDAAPAEPLPAPSPADAAPVVEPAVPTVVVEPAGAATEELIAQVLSAAAESLTQEDLVCLLEDLNHPDARPEGP